MKLSQKFDTTNIEVDIDQIFNFAHRDYKSCLSSKRYFGITIVEYWTEDFIRNGEDFLNLYLAREKDVVDFLMFQVRILQLSQEDDYKVDDFRSFLEALKPKRISSGIFMKEVKSRYSIVKRPDMDLIDLDPKDCVMLIEEWNDVIGACKTKSGYFGFHWATSA